MPKDIRRAVNIPLEDQLAPDFPQFTLGLAAKCNWIFTRRDRCIQPFLNG